MNTEGDKIKINDWLLPFSWIYGFFVRIRNNLFELGILKQKAFGIPVIAVGNITVGGTGKTPHVEYLIRLLQGKIKVAVLSRGYKRKTKGYLLADEDSTSDDIGDEPKQIKDKFENIYVAVDKDRCNGIERLTHDQESKDVEVVILDDAYQHRYVKPGINILLVNYNRQIANDKMLPAGRLREPKEGTRRADMVIMTKCPKDMKPMEFRVLTKALALYPYQDLYFTTIDYGEPYNLFSKETRAVNSFSTDTTLLLVTGIASSEQLAEHLKTHFKHVVEMSFGDHHRFKKKNIEHINQTFSNIEGPKVIITTEKDAARLGNIEGLSDEVRQNLFVIPVSIRFMLDQEENFNNKILSYVQKNSRNSILVKRTEEKKPEERHATENKPRTISFRDN